MWTKDRSGRQHDAVTLRCFGPRERILDVRKPRTDEHAVGGLHEYLQSHVFEVVHDFAPHLARPLVQARQVFP